MRRWEYHLVLGKQGGRRRVNSVCGLAVLGGSNGSTPVLFNKGVDWAEGGMGQEGGLGLCCVWIWISLDLDLIQKGVRLVL